MEINMMSLSTVISSWTPKREFWSPLQNERGDRNGNSMRNIQAETSFSIFTQRQTDGHTVHHP